MFEAQVRIMPVPGKAGVRMAVGKQKLLLVEGKHTPHEELADTLRQFYDVEIVPLDRAAEAFADLHGQAVLAEDMSPELAGRLLAPQTWRILDGMTDGVCVYTGSRLRWSNTRFASLEESTRQSIFRFCQKAMLAFNSRSSENGGQAPDATRRMRTTIEETTPEGRRVRFHDVLVIPVEEHKGRVEAVAAATWDVTESRQRDMKIDAIDRMGEDLIRMDADEVRKLNSQERLALLEKKIIRYARERLAFDHFTIHLLNTENNRLELVMSEGLPPEVREVDLYAEREGNGIVGYVAATGSSYICTDTEKDDRYIAGLARARSSLTAPLLIHDRVIGVFNVESDSVNAFSEEDRRFTESFARHVALAFHILDLLVLERFTTGEAVSSTVEGEIKAPLEDLLREAGWLDELAARDPEAAEHAARILRDIEAIRRRVHEVRQGPRSILGMDDVSKEPSIDPILRGKRVLVVDDEECIRSTIADILIRRGAIVDTKATGSEAIAALQSAGRHGNPEFDLLLSDIKLPDRTGYEIFAEARRLRPGLPVILMTGFGYDPHHSIVRASQDGLQCVLFKPFRAQRLLDELRKPFGSADLHQGS